MIRINNLKKEYNYKSIINVKEYAFPQTGMVCIYGKSGSGKTTLLNILALLEKPTSGEIFINEKKAPIALSEKSIRFYQSDFSYITQNPLLIPTATVEENLQVTKKNKYQILEILRELEIDYTLKQKVNQLSGGERSRVAIALAISKQSKIIFADEPTGNVDYENMLKIFDILQNLAKKCLVIVVSHEPYFIENSKIKIDIKDWN